MPKRKLKVYLISRISEDAHHHNEKVAKALKPELEVFVPHLHNPCHENHHHFSLKTASVNLRAMEKSDIGLLLLPYGRDCAWEAGWFAGQKNKKQIIFVHDETAWLRDWMLKSGTDAVITDNKKLFAKLKKDPVLESKKVLFVETLEELKKVLMKIAKT